MYQSLSLSIFASPCRLSISGRYGKIFFDAREEEERFSGEDGEKRHFSLSLSHTCHTDTHNRMVEELNMYIHNSNLLILVKVKNKNEKK